METITLSANKTKILGENLSQKLKGGEIIALIGDLGSGKTTFIQGLARGLGITEQITSPTFVLCKEYALPSYIHLRGVNKTLCLHRVGVKKVIKKFVHIDSYRLENVKEAQAFGIQDYFSSRDLVVAIEWADKIRPILPKNTIFIKFQLIDLKKRKIIIDK